MPYHVKTPKALGTGDVYWKGNNSWTETYADTTETRVIGGRTMTYAPKWFANSTVVTE